MVGFDYDYVIVGAGSAGCVLAARLSEDPAVRLAPVEAGRSDDSPEIYLPVAFPQLFKTEFDRDFATEPEPALRRRRRIHIRAAADLILGRQMPLPCNPTRKELPYEL